MEATVSEQTRNRGRGGPLRQKFFRPPPPSQLRGKMNEGKEAFVVGASSIGSPVRLFLPRVRSVSVGSPRSVHSHHDLSQETDVQVDGVPFAMSR